MIEYFSEWCKHSCLDDIGGCELGYDTCDFRKCEDFEERVDSENDIKELVICE